MTTLMAMPVLTSSERAELQRLEDEISAFGDRIAANLKAIRDKRLYRAGHSTFEDYVRERWAKSKQWAYNQITFAEMTTEFPVIQNTNQAKALSRVPLEHREQVAGLLEHLNPSQITAGIISEVGEVVQEARVSGQVEIAPGVQVPATQEALIAAAALATVELFRREDEHRKSKRKPPVLELKGLSVRQAVAWDTIRDKVTKVSAETPVSLTVREFGKGIVLVITKEGN